jgi:hypothetical protein
MNKVGILASVCAVLAISTVALAAGEYDVKAGKGEITISAKGDWHVNKDYPWKATAGSTTFDKSKFSLDEKSAKVSGLPAGKVHLKGAVCHGTDQCMPFETDVEVK